MRKALRSETWRKELGASEFVARATKYEIRDLPLVQFTEGAILREIPPSEEDRKFGKGYLEGGCSEGVYKEVGIYEIRKLVADGNMVSSSFVVWQGHGEDKKGRLVVN